MISRATAPVVSRTGTARRSGRPFPPAISPTYTAHPRTGDDLTRCRALTLTRNRTEVFKYNYGLGLFFSRSTALSRGWPCCNCWGAPSAAKQARIFHDFWTNPHCGVKAMWLGRCTKTLLMAFLGTFWRSDHRLNAVSGRHELYPLGRSGFARGACSISPARG